MRVGFDAHMVGEQETGNETYALGLLLGLHEIGFPVDTYAFRPLPFSIHRQHRIFPRASTARVPLALPARAIIDRLDLLHTTYILPPLLPTRAVVTVHDVTFALYPEWFPARLQRMLSVLVPRSLKQARRIITISQRTKDDIVRLYGTDPNKIAVTHLAPRPAFASRLSSDRGVEPFFLYVGNVHPRKNVETLVRAMRILKDRGERVPLVVAGKPAFRSAEVLQLVEDLDVADLVRFPGYVPDETLQRMYATCTALVHPALYEGFGLTVVEGMVQGAPVIAADTSSLPEVVGDGGVMVPARDAEAWAQVMARVASSARFREELERRALERSSSFSWRRCAADTVAVYHAALRRPG